MELKENLSYQVIMKKAFGIKNFVGYLTYNGKYVLQFRVGTDDYYVIAPSEIKQIIELSPQIIETRKTTGKFFIY